MAQSVSHASGNAARLPRVLREDPLATQGQASQNRDKEIA
jgi:hypothetical protein